MNEDKIRAEFEAAYTAYNKIWSVNMATAFHRTDNKYFHSNVEEAWNIWQAALSTRPELAAPAAVVRALEEIKQEASINFVSGIASLWQCIQSIKTMAIQALAKHKAGAADRQLYNLELSDVEALENQLIKKP